MAGPTRTAAPAAPASATAAHQHPEAATTGDAARRAALVEAANMFPETASSDSQALAGQLARARLATARYATSLRAAKAAGYQIITRMIPDMGWHFLNPTIQGFDVATREDLVAADDRDHVCGLRGIDVELERPDEVVKYINSHFSAQN